MTVRDVGGRDDEDVAVCVRTINETIGELARCHGAAAVVAALTEIMGCSSCILDTVERALTERPGGSAATR